MIEPIDDMRNHDKLIDYNHEGMNGFYLAIGKQGSGKTLFITKLMVEEKIKFKERKLFSNYTIFDLDFERITFNRKIESERGLESEQIIDILEQLDNDPNYFNNSIMLLDEIHIYLDSLDFMKKNNRRMQTFFSQLRKRNILLLATTQYIMNVDIRIRRQCMAVFAMVNEGEGIFEVTTHDIDGYYTTPLSEKHVILSDYYKYYDTNEIIT